jgi:hypothetical protein
MNSSHLSPGLFDPGVLDPRKDAAPTGIGAGVDHQNTSHDPTSTRKPTTPAVRHDAPETSLAAAVSIVGHAPRQRAAVLAYIESRGVYGATDPEIVAGVGVLIQSVNPRRGELAQEGAIVPNGTKRPSPSNRLCRVWVAAKFAPPTPTHTPMPEGGAA